MPQAKSLTPKDIEKVLAYIDTTKYAMRNRALFLTALKSGMRVGEIANLKIGDVIESDGSIKGEIRLSAEQTKGSHGRTVFISKTFKTSLRTICAFAAPLGLSVRYFSHATKQASRPTHWHNTFGGCIAMQA